MRMRNLLLLSAIFLMSSATALAQRTPPQPSAPTPPVFTFPVPAPGEQGFSFYVQEGNYLGVSPEEINRENMSRYGLSSPRGVGVTNVSEGSPADKAGIRKGDVILQFDGEAVTSTRKLFRLIGEAAPEQNVRLTISRNGSEQQLSATLGKREDAARTAYRALIPGRPGRPGVPSTPGAPQIWGEGNGPGVYFFGNNRRVGITSTPLTKQLADFFGISSGRGLLITSVTEGSPAAKAGLKAGDVITEVNGAKVEDTDDFIREVNRKEEGDVTLTIIRDRNERSIKVTPERRQQTPSFNLSELQSLPSITRVIPQGLKMEMPDIRVFNTVPMVESFTLPKINTLVTPRMMNLPRIELPRIEPLRILPPAPFEME